MNSATAAKKTVEPGPDCLKRAREGDPEAFASLFQAYKARIYSVCLRMTNNPAEAEDLTQEAFLQAFRKVTNFRGDSAFSTWLHRIAVNAVLMHFRKRSLNQVSLDEPFSSNEDGAKMRYECGTKDEALTGCVDRIALARAMAELPPGYRTIFLLHEVEGYEHQEIAEMLSCSVGNSKSQLHKAKLRLRELLAKAPEPRPSFREYRARTGKRLRQKSKNWNPPIGQKATMLPASLIPVPVRPTIRPAA